MSFVSLSFSRLDSQNRVVPSWSTFWPKLLRCRKFTRWKMPTSCQLLTLRARRGKSKLCRMQSQRLLNVLCDGCCLPSVSCCRSCIPCWKRPIRIESNQSFLSDSSYQFDLKSLEGKKKPKLLLFFPNHAWSWLSRAVINRCQCNQAHVATNLLKFWSE